MKKNSKKTSFNLIGEFKDKTTEDIYIQNYIQSGKKLIAVIVIAISTMFFVTCIFDEIYLGNQPKVAIINGLIRVGLTIQGYLSAYFIFKNKSNKKVMLITVCFLATISLSGPIMLCFRNDQDFLRQGLSFLAMSYGVFLVPLRWLYSTLISIINAVVFIVASSYYIDNIPTDHYISFIVVISGTIFIAAIGNFALHRSLRIQFFRKQELDILYEQQKTELTEAKVDIMISQINPHFLYNSLTTIRALCEIDSKEAMEAITDFSEFLRANMNSLTNKFPIPFIDELRHTQTYLNLERKRFEERLNIVYKIGTENFSIPPLTLQPIVENAVRHGIMKKEEGGTISIETTETENAYVISVIDDGIGFDKNQTLSTDASHIGFINVRKRIETLCNGTVTIESTKDIGTTVIITIGKKGGKYEDFNSR